LEANRVAETRDHTGHRWQYRYDNDGCLIEIVQPAIRGINGPPRIQYSYDAQFRLLSITDPKGQTFLRNTYDQAGRVHVQEHGGGVFRFDYEPTATGAASRPVYRTRVTLKNGGLLQLLHDASGRVLERTLPVRTASLKPADRPAHGGEMAALTTTSRYNGDGELVQRSYPATVTCASSSVGHKEQESERGRLSIRQLSLLRKAVDNARSGLNAASKRHWIPYPIT